MNTFIHDNNLTTEYWGENIFRAKKREWEELLLNSDADPLFLSWNWLYEWWVVRKNNSCELAIIAVYENKHLIGIAPLYIEKSSYLKGLVPTKRLQFLGKGHSPDLDAGIRAEYMDFIIRSNRQKQALLPLLEEIENNHRWTELSLCDINTEGNNYPFVESWLTAQDWHGRTDAEGYTFVVDCTLDFEDYLMSLGKNTRLKLFNRRKLLENYGHIELEFISEENKDELFLLLNTWHSTRWGSLAVDENNRKFYDQAFGFSSDKISLNYSCILKIDNKPLSVMVNADRGGRIYNLQSTYIEHFNKKIALGTLHIGYILEYVFKQSNLNVFDLLEGRGKHSDYKSSMAKSGTKLASGRWFRGRLLKLIFQFYDYFLRKLKRTYLTR